MKGTGGREMQVIYEKIQDYSLGGEQMSLLVHNWMSFGLASSQMNLLGPLAALVPRTRAANGFEICLGP